MVTLKNKKAINALQRSYLKIPDKLFRMNLPSHSISIFCFMVNCSETFDPGLDFIGDKLQLSRPTVIKYIKILISKNIIIQYKKGTFNKFSEYWFVDPKDWKINET